MAAASPSVANSTSQDDGTPEMPQTPPLAILDFVFPGFSMIAGPVLKYFRIDLNVYIPMLMLVAITTFAWNYFSSYFWDKIEAHFMSVVDIRTDDEIYNILMAWVAAQRFSQGARRFVVNTNVNSRAWCLWRWDDDDEDEISFDADTSEAKKKQKALSYTPAFGSHYFWYRGHLLLFRRSSNREQSSFMLVSEREEISISCFGRDPKILKDLINDARQQYMEKDEKKTLIYRGTTRSGSSEPTWQRCMTRANRPFSTVILNEKTKKELIADVSDYLCPSTQRWYANRGIPYRRGYLLHGPPGTGKSSLSLALAGFFKMRIYIVSLSSITANEENLATLFAELPRRCVVLLEDIDTAGLTHTRAEDGNDGNKDNNNNNDDSDDDDEMEPGQTSRGNGDTNKRKNNNNNNNNNNSSNRLSLSGLLNILDGVASQEGRVLIMTTNHIEKLDKALIRPGRVDMTVNFGLADVDITSSIFKAIFAHLEGDDDPEPLRLLDAESRREEEAKRVAKRAADDAHVEILAAEFAKKVPSQEFSPAELQGYLLRNKRDAQAAVEGVEEFVENTRKERKEKEIKDAEDRRKAEEKAKEEAAKKEKEKKEREEKKQKEKEEKEKKDKEADAKKDGKDKEKSQTKGGEENKEGDTSSEDESTGTSDKTKNKHLEVKTERKKNESSGRCDSGYVTPASGDP